MLRRTHPHKVLQNQTSPGSISVKSIPSRGAIPDLTSNLNFGVTTTGLSSKLDFGLVA
jgi:hypothetical protein